MEFQSAVFPAPQSSYSAEDNFEEIIYIPRNPSKPSEGEELTGELKEYMVSEESAFDDKVYGQSESIPCMLFRYTGGSSKIMLFFHGNAEDVGLSSELLEHLMPALKIHILAVEYPGYGIYRTKQPTEQQILDDSLRVYDYLTSDYGFPENNIIIFGRSIGSGPATYVASQRTPTMLALMSPFRSIKDVVGTLVGRWAKWLMADKFNNFERIEDVDSPVFIIHGLQDTLIPKEHAEDLHAKCKNISQILIPENMDHNNFDFFDDLT
jgi:pimeloyl-ACP methyl ester carboxylesterase